MFFIRDHRLLYPSDCSETPLLSWLPSPHYNQNREIVPNLLVIHYTAGASARSTAEWCTLPESRVSYHVIIDRDGAIIQQVPFNRRAWHAGQASWNGHNDVNSFSIGIGLANWGWLPPDKGVNTPGIIGTLLSPHKSNPDKPYLWECYPRAQLLTLCALVAALVEAYPISAVVGHDDIAPNRKLDPGPAFYSLPAYVDRDVTHPLFSLLDCNPGPF